MPYSDDKPHEECGIVGAYIPEENVARINFFGLFALQHRGQESAGIATSQGDEIHLQAKMGLVSQVFDYSVILGQADKKSQMHPSFPFCCKQEVQD